MGERIAVQAYLSERIMVKVYEGENCKNITWMMNVNLGDRKRAVNCSILCQLN